MTANTMLEKQLQRVHRRLLWQKLLNASCWCVGTGLLLVGLWFVLVPFLPASPGTTLKWSLAGGLLALSATAAGLWAWLKRPTLVEAALALDERFLLKERVTTSLTLTHALRETEAGLALLKDANQKVAKLDMADRFPVRTTWGKVGYVALGGLLAALPLLFDPAKLIATTPDETSNNAQAKAEIDPEQEKELKKALDGLKKKDKEDEDASEKIQEFDEEIGKIASKSGKNENEDKSAGAELTKLEAQMKAHQEKLRKKQEALQEKLKEPLDRLQKKPKEGPAKDLAQALSRGDTERVKQELDRLSKQMQQGELSGEELAQLKEQFEELQDQLKKLTREKSEEEMLKELAEQGVITKETLERELERLKKNPGDPNKTELEKLKELLDELEKKGELEDKQKADEERERLDREEEANQDLQDAMDALKEAQEALEKGDTERACKCMERAGMKMDGSKEQGQLAERLRRVQAAKRLVLKAGNRPGSGQNGGGPGSGNRPIEKDDNTGFERKHTATGFDNKGGSQIVGDGPSMGKKKPKSGIEIAEDVKERVQQAPAAVGKQGRVTKDVADLTRGYFENLGGQKEKK